MSYLKAAGLKGFTTWICQKEMLGPTFVLQLFHHALLKNRVLANHLNKVGILKKNQFYSFVDKKMFKDISTLIKYFKFFSLGYDLPPSTAIGYFVTSIAV